MAVDPPGRRRSTGDQGGHLVPHPTTESVSTANAMAGDFDLDRR